MGLSKYKTVVDVWDRLNGIAGSSATDNAAMERGRTMEPIIKEKYKRVTGRDLHGSPPRLYHHEHPFLHATPDDYILSGQRVEQSGVGILEVKCLGQWTFKQTKEQGIDPSYYAQIQHYMFVTGHQWGSFAVFNADAWELYWFDVNRDEVFIANMLDQVLTFWLENVETNRRPTSPMENLYPEPIMGDVEVHEEPEWQNWMRRLKEAKEQKEIVEYQEKQAEEAIKNLMGSTTKIRVPGFGKVSWTESERRTLDKERLLRAHPEISLEEFENVTRYRSFRPSFD